MSFGPYSRTSTYMLRVCEMALSDCLLFKEATFSHRVFGGDLAARLEALRRSCDERARSMVWC